MGVGSGWAGLLMLLLLLMAARAAPTATPSRLPDLSNLSRVARPPAPPAPPPGPAPRGQVQYTLDLLASPASRETDEHENARLAARLTVEAQLLPWTVGVGSAGGLGCLEGPLAERVAHLALQHHPPPAGVALIVLPPPPGKPCCAASLVCATVIFCSSFSESVCVLCLVGCSVCPFCRRLVSVRDYYVSGWRAGWVLEPVGRGGGMQGWRERMEAPEWRVGV